MKSTQSLKDRYMAETFLNEAIAEGNVNAKKYKFALDMAKGSGITEGHKLVVFLEHMENVRDSLKMQKGLSLIEMLSSDYDDE